MNNIDAAWETATRIYHNPLACAQDVASFVSEGDLRTDFSAGTLRLHSVRSAAEEQKANYVFWCDTPFPADLCVRWEFRPLCDKGLAMLFFSAKAQNGADIFSPTLAARAGEYQQYHHGDLNAYHLSYYRRKEPDERAFHTCNLRKSYGLHLVAQGADPIPEFPCATEFYTLCLTKRGAHITFSVNNLVVLDYTDDATHGAVLTDGHIGFRQLAPFSGEYRNLSVYAL